MTVCIVVRQLKYMSVATEALVRNWPQLYLITNSTTPILYASGVCQESLCIFF